MGFFSDNLGFETFQLKDWWNKAKKNPEQLLLGAGDPLSAKMWSGITGKKYEPFVDQMGGPYGGHTVSAFGANDGGVYGRAEDAGINTKAAGGVHDVAHVVAAIMGAQGAAGAMGGGTGGGLLGGAAPAGGAGGAGSGITSGLTSGFSSGLGAGTGSGVAGATGGLGASSGGFLGGGLGVFANGGAGGMAGVGGGNAGALAASGGISGGAGMGSATAPASMGMQDYVKMGQGLLGNSGQQQQQQPGAAAPQVQRTDPAALRAQLAMQNRAQQLRRKPRRTADENAELRQLTQGLLSA